MDKLIGQPEFYKLPCPGCGRDYASRQSHIYYLFTVCPHTEYFHEDGSVCRIQDQMDRQLGRELIKEQNKK